MFNKPRKDSDLQDLYGNVKAVTDIPVRQDDAEVDPLYKFKKNFSLSTSFEVYLQGEKKIKKEEAKAKEYSPMEMLVKKIKREEHLALKDLQQWVQYNFLVFKEAEQQRIKMIAERQQWFWKWMSVMMLPFSFTSYAVLHYQFKFSPLKSMIFASVGLYSICELGTLSTKMNMDKFYRELYTQYKDEVLLPQYRGLKLHGGKTPSQIDNKELTSSNLDDLKALINKNRG